MKLSMLRAERNKRYRSKIVELANECIGLKTLMNNVMPLPNHISMREHLQRILDTEAYFSMLIQSAKSDINDVGIVQEMSNDTFFRMIDNLLTDKYCGSYEKYTCDELFASATSGNFCKEQVDESIKCNEVKLLIATFIYKLILDIKNSGDFWWKYE